jgi:aryl-alcohol dehydrogenase-like predicted oxidoreductase
MKVRLLGNTKLQVSEIGLGAWQLGEDRAWRGPDEDESLRIVDEALRLGCTFIDTAPGYAHGRSEALIGRALEGRRDAALLCTKFGHSADGRTDFAADSIRGSLEESLVRLRTDHVDVLLMHSPSDHALRDPAAPQFRALEELKSEGLVRAYGISLDQDTNEELDEAAASGADVIEVRFNVLHQEPLPAIERAADRGLGIVVKVPLESGWLSGRYTRESTFGDVRRRWSVDGIQARATLVDEIATLVPPGTPLAQAALRFLLAHETVSTVIPGACTLDQLRENVAAADDTLPPDVTVALHQLWQERLASHPFTW